jgi:hypothetical protein
MAYASEYLYNKNNNLSDKGVPFLSVLLR